MMENLTYAEIRRIESMVHLRLLKLKQDSLKLDGILTIEDYNKDIKATKELLEKLRKYIDSIGDVN